MSGEFPYPGDQAQEQHEQQRKKKQIQDTIKAKQPADQSPAQQQSGQQDKHGPMDGGQMGKGKQELKQTLDAKNASKKRVQDKTKPTDTKPDSYLPDSGFPFDELSTKPPKIDNISKSVPFEGYKIPKRTPPQNKTLDSVTRTSRAPPEDVFGKKKETSSKPDFEFPPEIIRRSDRVLSAKEKAERRRVAHPQDGVGRHFDKDIPADGVASISILSHQDKETQPKDKTKIFDEARRKGDDLGKRGELPTSSGKYDHRDGLRDMPIDVAINLLSEAAGAVKTVIDYTKNLVEAIGETHDKNIQAAGARGISYGISILWGDQKHINNPHIKEGKPYTTSELYKRVRGTFGKQIDYEMRFLKVEASGADKALKGSIDTLVKAVNPLMKKARTSADRQVVLKTFVDSAEKRIKELFKK